MSISHPESEEYGKHWSAERVAGVFKPSEESVKRVVEWLVSSGVERGKIGRTRGGGWLVFEGRVGMVERLLGTEYWLFRHEITGQGQLGCGSYFLPEGVREHVDFVTPTVHFDVRVGVGEKHGEKKRRSNRERREEKRESGKGLERRKGAGFGPWRKPWPPKLAPITKPIHNNLADCSNNITPNCLRALYGIPELPPNMKTHPNNSRKDEGIVCTKVRC